MLAGQVRVFWTHNSYDHLHPRALISYNAVKNVLHKGNFQIPMPLVCCLFPRVPYLRYIAIIIMLLRFV